MAAFVLNLRLGVIVIGLLSIAACSVPVSGGAAVPNGGGTTLPATTPVPNDGIDTRTVDPCTAFTDEQVKDLGVDQPLPLTNTGGKPGCTWEHFDAEPIGAYVVDTSDTIDISSYVSYPPDANLFKVGPFDAKTVAGLVSARERSCQVVIRVRPGQVLQVAYAYAGARKVTQATVCEEFGRPAAEMVVQTLLARGGR